MDAEGFAVERDSEHTLDGFKVGGRYGRVLPDQVYYVLHQGYLEEGLLVVSYRGLGSL